MLDIDFKNIEYLNEGNPKQKQAYEVLTKHEILEKLKSFNPLLVGTIPINIDIEGSDLDIACCFDSEINFKNYLTSSFQNEPDFKIWKSEQQGSLAIIASFSLDGFIIEVFGQNIPAEQQNAYRHMLIEHRILIEKGESFRTEVIALKNKGYKTEPAFVLLLGISGDPYLGLLEY